MSAKLATPGLLEIKIFQWKCCEVIKLDYDITNKTLPRESSYIVDVVMWPRFGNSRISIREVIIISVLKEFAIKTTFLKRWSCFKFNTFEEPLGMTLKFYTSVEKGLNLKDKRFLGLIPMFVELTGEKLVRGDFCSPHPE